MASYFYLVRHGENEKKSEDPSLTPLGVKQAQATKFLFKTVTAIFSSPSKRCTETAEIISKNLHLPYQINEALKERISFDDVPSMTYQDYLRLCWTSSNNRDYVLPNGETSTHTGNRLSEFLENLVNNNRENVVCISHQGAIADFLRNNFSLEQLEARYKNFDTIRENAIGNCSITTVSYSDRGMTLHSIGSSIHLY